MLSACRSNPTLKLLNQNAPLYMPFQGHPTKSSAGSNMIVTWYYHSDGCKFTLFRCLWHYLGGGSKNFLFHFLMNMAIQLYLIFHHGDRAIYFRHHHWRRSALNSAGALQGGGGEFRGIFTPFYTTNFRGLCKTGGARAPAAPPSSAPMRMKFL